MPAVNINFGSAHCNPPRNKISNLSYMKMYYKTKKTHQQRSLTCNSIAAVLYEVNLYTLDSGFCAMITNLDSWKTRIEISKIWYSAVSPVLRLL